MTRNGKRFDMGPDHRGRLKAVDGCLADRPKDSVGAYRFLRKLLSIAQKIAALAR